MPKPFYRNPIYIAGRVVTYIGLFLAAAGLAGGMRPYMELSSAPRIVADVLGNDIGYRKEGIYGFRLQLRWNKVTGEQRTTITTPVRAKSEEEARRIYPGRHLEPGKTYELFGTEEDPDHIQPFRGYNWATFGTFILLGGGGIIAFAVGMYLVRKGKKEDPQAVKKR